MNKKLPSVFANPITNKINNNERIYYGNSIRLNSNVEQKKNTESVEMKINRLFKSSKYVYKIEVEIETIDGINVYKIIGKNKNNLITLDNKLIPISSIIDIREL